MLNCFSSSAHDDDYRYSPSVLPQLSASTRANPSSPSRSPLVKRPSLRFDKKRPSYGSTSDGEKRALRKAMIGNPTGFKHVGGSGIVVVAEMSEKPSVKPPVPPRPLSVQTPPRQSSGSKAFAPLAPYTTTSTPPPRPPPPRERPFSLPVPPRTPLSDQSNRQPLGENGKIVRRQSLSPPPKRKPAPPVTPSLIQQVEGIVSKEIRPQGTRLEELTEKPKKTELEIEDIFSKSELRVIEKYEDVAEGRVETVNSTINAGEKGGETAWKGALKEIELAMR
ncbi:hypothetical protein JCM3765_006241 [Sporobolomyces pararoseus]